jgi:hypothetical protein
VACLFPAHLPHSDLTERGWKTVVYPHIQKEEEWRVVEALIPFSSPFSLLLFLVVSGLPSFTNSAGIGKQHSGE